ncbi:MAG: flagellar hook capping FlgD N-terminal domain-containing protein [Steroidobacteraceae bacterium]
MIDSIGSAAATSLTTPTSPSDGTSRTALGQNEFLTLMITQLRNQDPFKPLEPTEFLGQLAQFGTVSGIEGVKASLGDLSASLQGTQLLNGASLIGHSALLRANSAPVRDSGGIAGGVDVPGGYNSVEITVADIAGTEIRRFQIPAQSGWTRFEWDGRDATGEKAVPGQYVIRATAGTGNSSSALATWLEARIDSVAVDPTNASLLVNTSMGAVPLTALRQIQ